MQNKVHQQRCYIFCLCLLTSLAFSLVAHADDTGVDDQIVDKFIDQSTRLLLQSFQARTAVYKNQPVGTYITRRNRDFALTAKGLNSVQTQQAKILLIELHKVTGIKARWRENLEPEYYDSIIAFGSDKEIRKALRPHILRSTFVESTNATSCPFWFSASEHRQLSFTAGAIFNASEIPVEACLYKQLLVAYGLTYGTNWYQGIQDLWKPHNPSTLMAADRYLLSTLYHPDIKIGMLLDEAEPIIRRVLRDLVERDIKNTNN